MITTFLDSVAAAGLIAVSAVGIITTIKDRKYYGIPPLDVGVILVLGYSAVRLVIGVFA